MLLSDFSIKRPVSTVVIIIALMCLGLLALNKLRVNQIPDVEQPVMVVTIPYWYSRLHPWCVSQAENSSVGAPQK